jgi:MFS family permease
MLGTLYARPPSPQDRREGAGSRGPALFSLNQLLTGMSYGSMPALIGPTIGPIVGGFLTSYISWHWIFFINIPTGTLGIVLALLLMRDFALPPPPRFDFLGFVIVAIGLALLELAIEYLGRHIVAPWLDASRALQSK